MTTKIAINNKAYRLSLGSLLAAGSASGAIQHIDDAGFTVPFSSVVPWNIDQTGPVEALWFNTNTAIASLFASVQSNAFNFLVISTNKLNNLATGYVISGGRSFTTYANPMIGNAFYYANGFSDGVEGIMGFKFQPGSTVLYGWAHIQFDLAANLTTITDWAYDDSGATIPAGVIPEPETAALGLAALALGAAGLRRWRKRK